MRERALKTAKLAGAVLSAGVLYLVLHELTGFALFCPFKRFLNLYCPGCGVSRMFFHLAHLEISEAFSSNCVVFCLLPVGIAAALYHGYRYIRYGSGKINRAENGALCVIIGVLIAFGIARNIFQLPVLIP